VKYVSSQKPSGQVVAESPTAGTTVRSGSRVQISVSLGPSATTAQVPNVVGQDQQTATSTLQNAGFQVQVIMVPTSDASQNGVVIDEQPSGGTRAPDGSTVTIYVGSSG
jgi:beta-lactam-binding protein with PASTA domain